MITGTADGRGRQRRRGAQARSADTDTVPREPGSGFRPLPVRHGSPNPNITGVGSPAICSSTNNLRPLGREPQPRGSVRGGATDRHGKYTRPPWDSRVRRSWCSPLVLAVPAVRRDRVAVAAAAGRGTTSGTGPDGGTADHPVGDDLRAGPAGPLLLRLLRLLGGPARPRDHAVHGRRRRRPLPCGRAGEGAGHAAR